jgi:arabinofuranosyltransferase
VGLGPLVRPDLTVVSGIVLAAVLIAQWGDDGWVDRARLLGAAVAVPVAYQVFRMGYYAALVPNTALAKGGGNARWLDGRGYLRDLVQPYLLVVPLAALVAAVLAPAVVRARRSGRPRAVAALVALPVGGLVHGFYIVRVGGDYMHARLLLPALFALLVPVAAVPLPAWRPWRPAPDRHGPRDIVTLGAVGICLAWAVLCLTTLRWEAPAVPGLFTSDGRAGHERLYGARAVTAADHGFGPADLRPEPSGAEVVVGRSSVPVRPPPGLPVPAYASFAIGVSGYAFGTDVHVIDMLGLADPFTARFEVPRPGLIGHEKPIPPAWLAARISTGDVDPDDLPGPPIGWPLWESSPARLDADADAARAALRCGDLRDLDAAVHARLTPGRFLSNIVHAGRNTALTIPADPTAARDRFCGRDAS